MRAHRTWLAESISILLVGWIVYSSQSFQTCLNNGSNQTSRQFLQKEVLYRGCLGTFVNENKDTITALSTFFIAWFTLTLWGSTRGLWLADEIHAERERRAYVVAIPAALYKIDPNGRIHFTALVQNGGKTPTHSMVAVGVMRLLPHPLQLNFGRIISGYLGGRTYGN